MRLYRERDQKEEDLGQDLKVYINKEYVMNVLREGGREVQFRVYSIQIIVGSLQVGKIQIVGENWVKEQRGLFQLLEMF